MTTLTEWTDDQLGQQWANIFSWAVMEIVQGKTLLPADQREKMAGWLDDLEAEMVSRGLETGNHVHNRAFREANYDLFTEEDKTRLIVMMYGRDVRKDKTP